MTLFGPVVNENSRRILFLQLKGWNVDLPTWFMQSQGLLDISVIAHCSVHRRCHSADNQTTI